MLAFIIYATINTKASIMERYYIPVGRLGERMETLQSAIFFPLTIAQMGRHTASYDDYEGVCCNATGIVEHQEPWLIDDFPKLEKTQMRFPFGSSAIIKWWLVFSRDTPFELMRCIL